MVTSLANSKRCALAKRRELSKGMPLLINNQSITDKEKDGENGDISCNSTSNKSAIATDSTCLCNRRELSKG
jgi:hypothetical protein